MNKWYTDEEYQNLPPSKSELKREMHALQQLGEKIVKLSNGQFVTIPLEGILKEAITTARRINSREGLRRQMQYIGKLLRETDLTAIESAFNELENGRVQAAQNFHEFEQWCDTLIEQGPKYIESVIEKYPQADRQHLRQLVIQAGKEKKANKPPTAAQKVFKYLRELDES
jgi:ribosome-associated protein